MAVAPAPKQVLVHAAGKFTEELALQGLREGRGGTALKLL